MPYIPHTQADIDEMLNVLELDHIQQLFDEVPNSIAKLETQTIGLGLSEMEITRQMCEHAPLVEPGSCFIGAGAYDHHIPAAIWDIVGRGEFYSAYTPYQAEASQGTLQLLYEYQTMMANLMGMEVANASLYDGASALAEAVLMAVRIKRGRAKRVLVPTTIHPEYRKVLQAVLQHQDIFLEELPYCSTKGNIDANTLDNINSEGLAAVIIPQPNFFGTLEEVDALTQKVRRLDALTIALVNPIAMALLKEPGSWGGVGADIVCGEGQPLGVPLMSGGPYFGFICCRQEHVRQLPGRIVGRTHDHKGREGFVLTLQAREQHIRRSKATSNICTNQGLLVTAATIYMSLMGPNGLRDVAASSHHLAAQLKESIKSIDGVDIVFDGPMFHEFVIRLNKPVEQVEQELAAQGLQVGYNLKKVLPELGESLLVCVTETKTRLDLERYQLLMAKALR
jgi:glycine dehydrogenase subunit 1